MRISLSIIGETLSTDYKVSLLPSGELIVKPGYACDYGLLKKESDSLEDWTPVRTSGKTCRPFEAREDATHVMKFLALFKDMVNRAVKNSHDTIKITEAKGETVEVYVAY